MIDAHFRTPTPHEVGKNFRLLRRGEILRKTDEVFFLGAEGKPQWTKTVFPGTKVGETHTMCNYRRRLKVKKKKALISV